MTKFVLVGPHEEKTIHLAGHDFEDGVTVHTFLAADAKRIAPIMKLYSAYPAESLALEHARAVWAANQAGEVAPEEPELPPMPEEDKGTEPKPDELTNEKLLNALASLDPEDDKLWVKASGLPTVLAVEAILGQGYLNRAVISAAAPDFNREAARAARAPKA